MILILRIEKYILRRIGLYFWGFGERLNYFLVIWGAKGNTFREERKLFLRIWVDQFIIFRDQGSTDPHTLPPEGGGGGSIKNNYKYILDQSYLDMEQIDLYFQIQNCNV